VTRGPVDLWRVWLTLALEGGSGNSGDPLDPRAHEGLWICARSNSERLRKGSPSASRPSQPSAVRVSLPLPAHGQPLTLVGPTDSPRRADSPPLHFMGPFNRPWTRHSEMENRSLDSEMGPGGTSPHALQRQGSALAHGAYAMIANCDHDEGLICAAERPHCVPPPARRDRARRARRDGGRVPSALCSCPPQPRWRRVAPSGRTLRRRQRVVCRRRCVAAARDAQRAVAVQSLSPAALAEAQRVAPSGCTNIINFSISEIIRVKVYRKTDNFSFLTFYVLWVRLH
jgi:hypothetical protein